MHQQQIDRYGGLRGIRDSEGLQSSLATPQASFGGEYLYPSIPAMAAAYLFHLCQNHAFVDGNKRVGSNAAITFLLMNDWESDFEPNKLADLVLSGGVGCRGLSCVDIAFRIALPTQRHRLGGIGWSEVHNRIVIWMGHRFPPAIISYAV